MKTTTTMKKEISRFELVANIKATKAKLTKAENSFPPSTKRDLHDLQESVAHAESDLRNHDSKKKPTTKIALGDVQRAVIIQTATIGEQTFAWWSDDDRFLVAIDGVGLGADACKAWFKEWFTIEPGQEINVHSLKQDAGETFVVQIRTK